MSKILIRESNLMDFVENQVLKLNTNMIITPGAKDLCRNKKITISYEESSETVNSNICKNSSNNQTVANAINEKSKENMSLSQKIMYMLRHEYGIQKEENVQKVAKRILELISEKEGK